MTPWSALAGNRTNVRNRPSKREVQRWISFQVAQETNLPSQGGLLVPGRNCWRVEHARRVSFLVDGAAYFRAVRAALARARHSIFILAWDIDSRMCLVPEGAGDGFPEPLGDFLHEVVARRRGLHAYVLSWDFSMVYALEREWLPAYKLGLRTHRRLSFCLDGRHPIGASHHQKVVVIDDALAFVGGLDLTRCRWDTPRHAGDEPLRRDADGKPYGPFHDVQVMVDGAAAAALGELARARWLQATGHAVAPFIAGAPDHLWPQHTAPDITDVDIAIARTEPRFDGRPGVEEIRRLHLDAIAAARRWLFFENQYFTSATIADALAQRLREAEGPEVVLVSPRTEGGWLEEVTMGVLRARLHRRLREADAHGRYRTYCPHLPGLDGDCLNVHSKLMVMDDDLLCIGSANLSNRSMALDTECNLAIEARGDPRIGAAIAALRSRLLAEHLATDPAVVAHETQRRGSLVDAIEALRGAGRSLAPLEPAVAPEVDALVPDSALIDPERPIDPDKFFARFVPREAGRPVAGRLARLGILALALVLLAAAWRWTPLRDWLNLQSLVALAQGLKESSYTPLAVLGGYVVAGLLVVPVMALIAATGVVFGPLAGALYALAGTLLSAAVTYGVGRWLGRDTVRRLVGMRVNRLSKRIARRGILAVAIVRLLPVAPFSLVNMVVGASHISLRDFLLGTALGMTPGILATVTFVHQLAEAIRHPSPGTYAVLAALALLLIALALLLRRLIGGRNDTAVGA